MKKKNVLYISYDGMTDPLGQSQVIPYLSLLSKDFEITILSFEKKQAFVKHKATIQELLAKYGIKWQPLFYHKSPPVLSTLFDILRGVITAFFLVKKNQVHIVHARSIISYMIANYLKKVTSVKTIFDMRGFWPDERVDGNLWNLQQPLYRVIYRYFKQKETLFINTADVVVTLTYAAKDYIQNNYQPKNEIVVIPCAADLDMFVPQTPAVKKEYREKIGLRDEFVLVYLGSLGTWYLLEEMLDFFVVLKRFKPDAKFLFITHEDKNNIINFAQKKHIHPQDIIVLKANRNEIVPLLSVADLSIFFIKPAFSKQGSSPTKHGELLGCNIPVVCNAIGDLQAIMAEAPTGVLIKEFSEQAYTKALEDFFDKTYQPADFQQVAKKYYDLHAGCQKYFSIYNSL